MIPEDHHSDQYWDLINNRRIDGKTTINRWKWLNEQGEGDLSPVLIWSMLKDENYSDEPQRIYCRTSYERESYGASTRALFSGYCRSSGAHSDQESSH